MNGQVNSRRIADVSYQLLFRSNDSQKRKLAFELLTAVQIQSGLNLRLKTIHPNSHLDKENLSE